MNLKFTFFYSISPNQRNKIKNKLLPLARNIYILSYDRHLFRLLPSTFHSFLFLFFFSPLHFSFHPRISFFPYPVIISLSPPGRKYPLFPLQIQTVPEVSIEKFVSKPFYTFLDNFTIFHTLESWDGKNSRSGEGRSGESENERSTAILNRTGSAYFRVFLAFFAFILRERIATTIAIHAIPPIFSLHVHSVLLPPFPSFMVLLSK